MTGDNSVTPATTVTPASSVPTVAVVGGGLAGIAAALECADRGARVTLVERRRNLGGLTWSFRHGDMWIDNGQHVFLRCCDEYLRFLGRIGGLDEVEMPARLDVPVVAPGFSRRPGVTPAPVIGRLARSSLPAPLHLAGSLLRYPHLRPADRVRLGAAVAALRRVRLEDPALDEETFGEWLARHHQTPASVRAVWDLITVPTVNLPSAESSLAMAAKVFKTGLLENNSSADIGWSRVPLGRLHGENAEAALRHAGVELRVNERVRAVAVNEEGDTEAHRNFSVIGEGWQLDADRVVVALPHEEAAGVLPRGVVDHQEDLDGLGSSAIVDVHLVYDRKVTEWPFMAAVHSPVQWVFDRTTSSGLPPAAGHQYLAVSISAADELLGRRPEDLVSSVSAEIRRLLPAAAHANIVDSLVTKERRATFAARPGTSRLRPDQATKLSGLAVAGAWTDTGWPATMEGAVRSGRAAARACLASTPNPAMGRSARIASTHQEVA
ncbi:MAG TPA: hydroxysqualene dehydroxylase HpnE [Acidimicrobiales bacterium]|nr:hydroxysqualene dehydroxylase HpnE [Acidimicrobiales bacterium]